MSKKDIIFIKNMRFWGYHGVLDFEKQNGQPFLVSLKLETCTKKPGNNDQLEDATNYALVFDLVCTIVEKKAFNLLERLAEEIAKDILKHFPLIKGITVTIDKPHAPISGLFDTVGIEIYRDRIDYE